MLICTGSTNLPAQTIAAQEERDGPGGAHARLRGLAHLPDGLGQQLDRHLHFTRPASRTAPQPPFLPTPCTRPRWALGGILLSGFRSDPGPQASHGGPSLRPRCSTHTQLPTLSCDMCLQVPPACLTTPLQRHLTNVFLLQASTSSRNGTFGQLPAEQHMHPHQAMCPQTAHILLIRNLATLRVKVPR